MTRRVFIDAADFQDAIQYYTAVAQDVDAVVTRNKKDYKSAEVPVLNAAECVEWARV